MFVAVEGSQCHSLRETVVAQIFVDVTHEVVVPCSDKSEATAQSRQSVELRERTRDDQVGVFVHQRGDVVRVACNETGVGLIYQHHRVAGDMLHDASDFLTRQTVARGIVGRSQQEHAGMDTVGIFNHLLHIIGEGVLHFM